MCTRCPHSQQRLHTSNTQVTGTLAAARCPARAAMWRAVLPAVSTSLSSSSAASSAYTGDGRRYAIVYKVSYTAYVPQLSVL